jgi:hypothetical protein
MPGEKLFLPYTPRTSSVHRISRTEGASPPGTIAAVTRLQQRVGFAAKKRRKDGRVRFSGFVTIDFEFRND